MANSSFRLASQAKRSSVISIRLRCLCRGGLR